MNRHKLVLSVILGATLTVGLLVGFSISRTSAMAPSGSLDTSDAEILGTAIRTQDTMSTAHVVVVFRGEKAAARSITWTGTISRVTALELAGFDVGNSGDAICNIEGDGCPTSNCWCSDNNWWQGRWNSNTMQWDSSGWPPDDLVDSDVIGFHNGDAWRPPVLPAPTYVGALAGLEWLRPRQDGDTGAYGGIGGTVETALAVAANNWDAGQWRREPNSPSLLHNMYSDGTSYVVNGGRAGKLATTLATTGGCWPVDAMKPTDYYSSTTGQYAPQAINQSWAMLGVKAMSQTVPAAAGTALKAMITESGGWGWPGFGDDTDTTATAIQALVAAGEPLTSTHVVSGLNYIKAHQNPDGGFNPGWTTETSNASTAAAVQAILAVGQDPLMGTWAISSTNPISYLVSAQQGDGSFLYGGTPDEFETRQSVVALLGRTYPLEIAEVPMCYGIAGHAKGPGGSPLADVVMTAEGWNNSGINSESDATGTYTISVPNAGSYILTPALEGLTFTPTVQTVEISGTPGDVVSVPDFAGATRIYLPLIVHN